MIIDPKGLFLGDRLAMCSDEAQLHWPRLYAAANNFARMELNYQKVVVSAYAGFKKPPSEAKFWDLIKEYRDNFLLFVYQHNGDLWGQWQTNERYLLGHKNAEDKRSPAPPYEAQQKYREEYLRRKAEKSQQIDALADLRRLAASCDESSELVGNAPAGGGEGEGEGVGVGEGSSSERAVTTQREAGGKRDAARSGDRTADAPPALGTLPCLGGKQWAFTPEDVDGWKEAYPAVDVMGELRKAREWLKANPKHGKTFGGMRSFANNWLKKEQNQARRYSSPIDSHPRNRPADVRVQISDLDLIVEQIANRYGFQCQNDPELSIDAAVKGGFFAELAVSPDEVLARIRETQEIRRRIESKIQAAGRPQ